MGGCSYEDYDLFMAAWAMPGDGCDDGALATKKDEVKAYQATCSKQFIWETGKVLTSMKESCFTYEYDVKTEGDYTCTSTVPISTCKADAHQLFHTDLMYCTTAFQVTQLLLRSKMLITFHHSQNQAVTTTESGGKHILKVVRLENIFSIYNKHPISDHNS